MPELITSYKQLRVFQSAMDHAMAVFEITKKFPREEMYSMTDQMRRSARSVCTNIGEAWRKRRYEGAFIAKLSDSETEACETQIWAEFARRHGYLNEAKARELDEAYDGIMAQLAKMIQNLKKWLIP